MSCLPNIQVVVYGGRLDEGIEEDTTHMVLARGLEPDQATTPAQLLAGLWAEKGGVAGLSALRRGLLAGSMHIVNARWRALCCRLFRSLSHPTCWIPHVLSRLLALEKAGGNGTPPYLPYGFCLCAMFGMRAGPTFVSSKAPLVQCTAFDEQKVSGVQHPQTGAVSWVEMSVEMLGEGEQARRCIMRAPEQQHAALPPAEGEEPAARFACLCCQSRLDGCLSPQPGRGLLACMPCWASICRGSGRRVGQQRAEVDG